MAFQWMSFSLKKNAAALQTSDGLGKLLKLDTDVYSRLGTVAADKAYASYRTSYKSFKTELRQAQSALTKLMAEQEKMLAALDALQGRITGVDNQLTKDLGDGKKVKNDKDEAKYKAMLKNLLGFSSDVQDLQSVESDIQANFRSLMIFLAGSKRAQD